MKSNKQFLIFNLKFLIAYCLLLIAYLPLNAQTYNTIDNDGTSDSTWMVGWDATARLSVGVAQDEVPSNNFTLGDSLTAGSQTFVSGWDGNGWKLSEDSTGQTLEIDNLIVRRSLSAFEFLVEQVRGFNGNLLLSSIAKIDSVWLPGHWFIVEDPGLLGTAPFAVNDMIYCKTALKQLVYKVDSVNNLKVYISALSGAPSNVGVVKKGDVFVRIGNTTNSSRSGLIGLYTDMSYGPYIRISDSVNSWDAFGSSVKVQIGNLTGITDPAFGGALEGYGAYIQNGYIRGKIIATNPEDFNVELTMPWDSVANKPAYFDGPNGKGLFIDADKIGFYNTINYPLNPWRSYLDSQGRFYLQGKGTDYLSWNDSILTIKGDGHLLDISANTSITDLESGLYTYATLIYQNTTDIALRARVTYVDSLGLRVTAAEGSIITHTSQIGGLSASVDLKARITQVDSLAGRVTTAEAGISLIASDIDGINANLLIYAKKDSLISKINVSPESVTISTSKLNIYGIIKAFNGTSDSTEINGGKIKTGSITTNKLTAGILTGFTIQTDTAGAPRIVMSGTTFQALSGDNEQGVTISVGSSTASLSAYWSDGTMSFGNGTVYSSDNLNLNGDAVYINGSLAATQSWVASLNYVTNTHGHMWSDITSGKPTTLSGYGITDAASSSHTHTFSSLTSKPTTLSGYGITDAYPLSGNPSGFITGTTGYSGTINFRDDVGDNHSFTFVNGLLQVGSY